jgi:hypothetical protein
MVMNVCEHCDAGFTFEENDKQVRVKVSFPSRNLVRADIRSLLGEFVSHSFVIDLMRYLDLHPHDPQVHG